MAGSENAGLAAPDPDWRPLFVRAYDGMISGFAVLAGLMIVFAMLIVCADVTLRFLSPLSLPWSFEVTEFLLVYIPLLTLPWLARRRQHIVIDIFTSWLSPSTRSRLSILVMLVAAATCLVVTYWGVIATLTAFDRGIVNPGLVAFPRWALLIAIPIGFGTTAIEFVRIAWHNYTHQRDDNNSNVSSAA